jgi:alpha-beta hydrolase superfamily lysophospholipase
MAERITFTTDDGVIIVGDWFPAPTVLGAVVLLHMMPETRTSWGLLQRELAKRSIASLAIDLRGHGESVETTDGNKLDYNEFTDEEHQASMFDVASAVAWVKGRGQDLERVALGGASIGANLALEMLGEEPKLCGAVLFSPSHDYRGMNALQDVQNILPHQALFIVSSEDDQESFADSRQLYDQAPTDSKTYVPYKNAGHGTHIFDTDRGLIAKTADWFADTIRGK